MPGKEKEYATDCNGRDCVYIERNAEISEQNQGLKKEVEKLKEEIRILQSDNKDLKDLIIKLNMRTFMNY